MQQHDPGQMTTAVISLLGKFWAMLNWLVWEKKLGDNFSRLEAAAGAHRFPKRRMVRSNYCGCSPQCRGQEAYLAAVYCVKFPVDEGEVLTVDSDRC